MIPITLLKKLETISELRVLTHLFEKSDDKGLISTSMNKIGDEASVSRNSVKKAVEGLIEKEIVRVIHEGKNNTPSLYLVSKVDIANVERVSEVEIPKHEQEGWQKATGTRKKTKGVSEVDTPQDNIYINNILKKDFKEINYIANDINSLSVINENIYLNDKQLGMLARKVLIEWFLPLANLPSNQSRQFFQMQTNHLKDLLVKYRTEQVLASIEYWTKVNQPPNGIRSLMWLKYEKRGTSHVQIALDYYKQKFLDEQNEVKEEERLKKVDEMKKNALEIVKKKQEAKQVVDAMSDNDFISNLLGNLGKIDIGGDE